MKNKKSEAFDNFEIEPSRELWTRIESNLPKAKKRRWLLWLFPAILFVVAGLYFIVKDFNSAPNQKIENKKQLINNQNNDRVGTDKSNAELKELKQDQNIVASNSNQPIIHKANSVSINKYSTSKILSHKNESHSINYNSSEIENNVTRNQNILIEETAMLEPLNYLLKETNSEIEIINIKVNKLKMVKTLSRWTLFAGSGVMCSNNENTNASGESSDNITNGIMNIYFDMGIRYDLTHRFRVSSGFSYLKAGQEQYSLTKIYMHGGAGNPNNTYSFNSSGGNLSGSGFEFDNAYFGSPDSALFSPTNHLATYVDTVRDTYVDLKQEFSYVQLPLMIVYKPIERRFTPYVGVYFSAAYLIKQSVMLNGERINYKYENGLSDFLFSGGITAGIDFNLNSTVGIFLNGFYQQGLNSIVNGNNWKPFIAGAGGGVKYRLCRKNIVN